MRYLILLCLVVGGCATPPVYEKQVEKTLECFGGPSNVPQCAPMWFDGEEYSDCYVKKDGTWKVCKDVIVERWVPNAN